MRMPHIKTTGVRRNVRGIAIGLMVFVALLAVTVTADLFQSEPGVANRRQVGPVKGTTTTIPLDNLQRVENLSPEACANVIVDGGFEAGDLNNPNWDPETSTNFGTPLCDNASCGTAGGAAPPRTGLVWAWFGGISAAETATIGQTVFIAGSSTATLNFWMRIGTVSSPFADVLNVRVDGTIVQSFPEPTVAEGVYTLRTINLNAFATGSNHQILFEYIHPGTGTSNYVVDDVTLDVCDLGPVIPPGQVFNSSLSPTQEVPAPTPLVSLTGSGVGQVRLNTAENQITVALTYTGLGTNAIAGHIHGSATSVPGVTAPIIFDLAPSGGTSGTNTATTFAITPAQVALLRQKLMYFNVHTTNNPSGEIRGQIHLNEMSTNFDADGKTDFAIFRPSNSLWAANNSSNNSSSSVTFGLNTDTLVPGDYDGDAKVDLGLYRNGDWFVLRSSDGTLFARNHGTASDIPAPADFDKDGRTDLAFFRSSAGPLASNWFILLSNGGTYEAHWGQNLDIPVPADYNRDGRADLAVVRPNDPSAGLRRWYIFTTDNGTYIDQQFGNTTDIVVPGDYDGDGDADIAVYRPGAPGTWFVSLGSAQNFNSFFWGTTGDIPVPGDYDSDGKTDYAVFRPAEGGWYIRQSFNGVMKGFVWGVNNDRPVPSLYNR